MREVGRPADESQSGVVADSASRLCGGWAQTLKGEIWLAFSGLLSIVLGAIVLWIFFSRPVESFLAAGWLLGFYAAVYGVTLLFLSWRLRKTRQG